MRLAAIDIGSNAAILLITDVISGPQGVPDFIKTVLVRVHLRLGFDVFDKGEISASKVEKIINTIKSYKLLLDVYEVKHLKACATSAMRDATNAGEIIKKVKDATGIQIEVISGDQEASFIYENHIAENLDKDIEVMWTGEWVMSESVTAEEAQKVNNLSVSYTHMTLPTIYYV